MSDPSLDLQGAIVAALKADPAVTALISGRVYDQVPPQAAFPYVTIGEDQTLPAWADCYDGADVILTLHAWSRAVGYPEVKRLAAAVSAALDGVEVTIETIRLVDISWTGSRFLRDPDGNTRHAVIGFRALTEPT